MKNKLVVSEKFYSIQGEGQTMGVPAVFLRLGGCNLLCKGKGWVCDSIEVWKKGVSTPFNEVLTEYIEQLKNSLLFKSFLCPLLTPVIYLPFIATPFNIHFF